MRFGDLLKASAVLGVLTVLALLARSFSLEIGACSERDPAEFQSGRRCNPKLANVRIDPLRGRSLVREDAIEPEELVRGFLEPHKNESTRELWNRFYANNNAYVDLAAAHKKGIWVTVQNAFFRSQNGEFESEDLVTAAENLAQYLFLEELVKTQVIRDGQPVDLASFVKASYSAWSVCSFYFGEHDELTRKAIRVAVFEAQNRTNARYHKFVAHKRFVDQYAIGIGQRSGRGRGILAVPSRWHVLGFGDDVDQAYFAGRYGRKLTHLSEPHYEGSVDFRDVRDSAWTLYRWLLSTRKVVEQLVTGRASGVLSDGALSDGVLSRLALELLSDIDAKDYRDYTEQIRSMFLGSFHASFDGAKRLHDIVTVYEHGPTVVSKNVEGYRVLQSYLDWADVFAPNNLVRDRDRPTRKAYPNGRIGADVRKVSALNKFNLLQSLAIDVESIDDVLSNVAAGERRATEELLTTIARLRNLLKTWDMQVEQTGDNLTLALGPSWNTAGNSAENSTRVRARLRELTVELAKTGLLERIRFVYVAPGSDDDQMSDAIAAGNRFEKALRKQFLEKVGRHRAGPLRSVGSIVLAHVPATDGPFVVDVIVGTSISAFSETDFKNAVSGWQPDASLGVTFNGMQFVNITGVY